MRLLVSASTVVILCFGYMLLGSEWTWGISGTWLINATSRLGVLPVLFVLGMQIRAFKWRRDDYHYVIYALCFLAVMILERVHVSEFDASIRFDFYVSVVQALVLGAVGLRLGRTAVKHRLILERLAWLSAVVAVISFLAPPVEEGLAFPTLSVGFPVGLIVLYGFCWYLYAWLSESGIALRPLLGVLACSLNVVLLFHKPILVPGFVGFIVLIVVMSIKTHRGTHPLSRATILVGSGLLLFVGANAITSNRLSEELQIKFLRYYLHANSGTVDGNAGEVVEQALGGRVELWQGTIGRVYASPWLGSGFGQTTTLEAAGTAEEIPLHNGYLDLLISVGILGSLPLLFGVVRWLWLALSKRGIAVSQGLTIPIAAYIICLMIYNAAGTSRLFVTVTGLAMFLMGYTTGWMTMAPREVTSGADVGTA